jgi:protein-tyrosine phosphatase
MLDEGVLWVGERIGHGEKVYVHCLHGVGRGPLLGCCVLMESGYTAADALKLLKTRRWQASPNQEQLAALLRYAERRAESQVQER